MIKKIVSEFTNKPKQKTNEKTVSLTSQQYKMIKDLINGAYFEVKEVEEAYPENKQLTKDSKILEELNKQFA